MSTPIPTFAGEVQLRRWSESSTQGVQVTFALADASDLEPLKIKSGKRFMAVLVEIGDDEQPVAPREVVAKLATVGPICQWLVMRSNEPQFWEFLRSMTAAGRMLNVSNANDAKDAVCEILGVLSRKEIDGDETHEKEFHRQIRSPYIKWLMRRGVSA